jgi:LuxR family maltose regulon positive regulatory protein
MTKPALERAWTQFDAAIAESHRGEVRAWSRLAAARGRFAQLGDSSGTMLASAALMVCGQLQGNYRGFDVGLADLAPLRDGTVSLEAPDHELLALTGWLLGLLMYRPNDPDLDRCVERILEVLDRGVAVNLLLAACRAVLFYVEPREKRELGQRLHALVEAHAQDPGVTPYRRAQWLWFWRRCARYAQQPEEAERAHDELHALVLSHGLTELAFLLALFEVEASLPSGELGRAESALARAEPLAEPARLRDTMLLEISKSRLLRLRGDADTSLLHAQRAHKLALELQVPPPLRAVYLVNLAQARLQCNDYAEARRLMEEAMPLVPAGYAGEIGEMVDGIRAYEAVTSDPANTSGRLAPLAALWKRLRERQFYDSFDGYPEFGAKLCVLALEHGIETEFVRSLVTKRDLAPPPDAPEAWPWPLQIHALGGFSVRRHGEALSVEGKAQKKPLALLQAVVASGATRDGRGIDVQTLIDELWPDVDAADPKASFEVTLSRLRKWLGVEGALRLVDGRLALNPRLVWCDVTAFERAHQQLQQHLVPHAETAPLPVIMRCLTGLYRGKLFGHAALDAWGVAPRERLAMQFGRAVVDYGHHLETQRDWAAALRVYEQGLAQDILAEPIYRALMRCHLALDQPGEAQRVFLRCQEVLLAALRVPPARETLALAARITGLPPAG